MATKHRYAAFMVYEDSAPKGWWDMLRDSHGMYARSFHHGEVDEQTGEVGKDHWHVMYCHGNSTTDAALLAAVPDGIAANGHVEVVAQPRGYMRYLLHLDNPEKEQFADGREHVECCNGFTLDLSRDLSADERHAMVREIFEFMRNSDIEEFSDLVDTFYALGQPEYMDLVVSHATPINQYLTSRRHKRLGAKAHVEPYAYA